MTESTLLVEAKPKAQVHKICSNGTTSFFAMEGDDSLTFKSLSKYPGHDIDHIKICVKNKKVIVYLVKKSEWDRNVTRKNKKLSIRNITRTCDHVDSFIKSRIKYSSSTQKSKFIRVAKYNKSRKLISDFLHKHLGFKIKKSKTIHGTILNALLPIDDIPHEYKVMFCACTHETSFQGARSIPEYLDRFLGKNRPKKLNKILYECITLKKYGRFIDCVLAYKYSKGIMDINHIYSALDNNEFTFLREPKMTRKIYYEWRRFIKRIPLRIYFDMLTFRAAGSMYIKDTMRQLAELPDFVIDSNIRTMRDLHDMVSLGYRRKQNPDFPLKNDDEVLALDGAQIDERFKVAVPKTSHELMSWGARMRNCIASYANSVNGKQRFLLGVYERSELKYNIEINNKIVRQFFGTGNSPPNKDDRKLIMDYLENKKLLSASTYNQFVLGDF